MANRVFEEIDAQQHRGVFLILTGPTGAGKDTLLDKIILTRPNTIKIITTTTRAPRENENEGNPYHFTSHENFEHMIGAGEFFEWVEFRGELYGTTKQTLTDALSQHKDVVWRIDMKGVKNIKAKVQKMTKRTVFVFLMAPTIETLENRVKRAENEGSHRWHPDLVTWETNQYGDCDYLVVNTDDALESAVQQVITIMDSKRLEIINEE